MKKSLAIITATLVFTSAIAENEISFEEISADNYRLILKSGAIHEVAAAQKLLAATALSLCDGKYPQYGHYKFEINENISQEIDEEPRSSFELVQDIQCIDAPAVSVPDSRSFIVDADAKKSVEDEIQFLSESYFSSLIAGEYDEAYSQLSENMRSYRSFEEWSTQNDEFRLSAGELVELNVHTITIYDNPPNAPQPGIYVAADYQNRFENTPYHCGYLLWFRAEVGKFLITREETGVITNETLDEVPEEQHLQLLGQMRCNAR